MAHKAQQEFCKFVRDRNPRHFDGVTVLDCGSLDINGNNRYLFSKNVEYTGVDLYEGPNVDIVCPVHEVIGSFDTIISTEMFEHDPHFYKTLKHVIEMLKSGGMFLFTCASHGRSEHGTWNSHPEDSPATNYHYQNRSELDFMVAESLMSEFAIRHWEKTLTDLYFYGVKR